MFWAFIAVVVAGVSYGLATRLLSQAAGQIDGQVVAVVKGSAHYKWPGTPRSRIMVKLPDGEIVDVAATTAGQDLMGQSLSLTRYVTPWGVTWYSTEN